MLADTNQVLIASGQRTINEIRTDDGLDPIEGGDIPIFAGSYQQVGVEPTVVAPVAPVAPEAPKEDIPVEEPAAKAVESEPIAAYDPETAHIQLVTELRTFRKYALKRVKDQRTIKPFESAILPSVAVNEINRRLIDEVQTEDEAKALFKEFMQDYQIDFLARAHELKDQIAKGLL